MTGHQLKRKRKVAGYTQSRLAFLVNRSVHWISANEQRGDGQISASLEGLLLKSGFIKKDD